MNYLSHFLIDHKPGRPLYNFGLALPDLVNVIQRGWKPAKTHHFSPENHTAYEIWQGYQQHLAADARFHNLPLFTVHSKRIRQEMEKHGLASPNIRLFFAAHVLLEMLIDRHIIKTRRPMAELFYEYIESVKESDFRSFFEESGTPMPPKFPEFFNRFRESRYLLEYENDEGLFYSINRLLGRTGQPAWTTASQRQSFGDLVAQEEVFMAREIETFLSGY